MRTFTDRDSSKCPGLVKAKVAVVIWVVLAIQPQGGLWKAKCSKGQSAAQRDQLRVIFLALENTPKDLSGYITSGTAIWSAAGKPMDQQFQMPLFGVKSRNQDPDQVCAALCYTHSLNYQHTEQGNLSPS